MKLKAFIIIFLMSTLTFTEIPKAQPISNVYKQGIYTVSQKGSFTATASLITPNNITTLIVIDPNSILKLYKRFDTINQSVNLDTIEYGDIAIIVGSGELSLLNVKLSGS
ncbi:hypothetical protein CLPUN_22720 [Clostridium puniceum]|uniref:Uncharacterized protein n=1 Tax=Clostridium puniceum TaxID=29367 RepID=A0A1S8THV1_9CLOT|nr:hypothetical protein [Clostridium puniceum]OOM77373.1 hypothetical protein CLPUN_22720 [Clostridium puniceum]